MLTTKCPVVQSRGFRKSRRHRELYRQSLRAASEALVQRSDVLPAWERELVELHLGKGVPLKTSAQVKGRSVSWLRRRLRAIRRRLNDPGFLAASRRASVLPKHLRAVSQAYYLDRTSLRQCARQFGMTVHAVRQTLISARTILLLTRAPANEPEA